MPEDHPYYDPDNPNELYATKSVVSREVKSRLNLHIWSNDSEKRDYIVKRVNQIFDEALNFNYKYCVNLTPAKDCKTTSKECDALNVMNALGIQGKCPYADIEDSTSIYYRNPSTYFNLAGVEIFSIEINPEINVDMPTPVPEVYHSVIGIDYEEEILTEIPVAPAIVVDRDNMDIDSPAKQ